MALYADRLLKNRPAVAAAHDAGPVPKSVPHPATFTPAAGLLVGPTPGLVHRKAEATDPLGGCRVSPDIEMVLARRAGGGESLPSPIAESMGAAIGADLTGVRIHTGDEPARLARAVQARAFTNGADIYFGAGTYSPGTASGQRLLAHELAHTVQHRAGSVSADGPIIGRAADPVEGQADRVADSVMRVLRRRSNRSSESISEEHSIQPDPGTAGEPWPMLRRPGGRVGHANHRSAIRRFYALVYETVPEVEYKEVQGHKYESLPDPRDENVWVESKIKTGWWMHHLYESPTKKAAAEAKKTKKAEKKKAELKKKQKKTQKDELKVADKAPEKTAVAKPVVEEAAEVKVAVEEPVADVAEKKTAVGRPVVEEAVEEKPVVEKAVVEPAVEEKAAVVVAPLKLGGEGDYDPLAFGRDQKFGNKPFSYQITTEKSDVKANLEVLFETLRAETSKAKNSKVTELFDKPHFKEHKSTVTADSKKLRTEAVKKQYPGLLRHGPIDERLQKTPAFTEKYELRAGSSTEQKLIAEKASGESVGVLLLGIAHAYDKSALGPGKREGMTKKHRSGKDSTATHVADDAGVPTRRFAYFETSRQQLMDGLGPTGMGALRGRYPRFREAMGLPSGLNKIDQNDVSVAQMYGAVAKAQPDGSFAVPMDVMPHVHQYLGNGLNQRGLSLASTKKEQVYSNDGDPFKSDDGIRIKVDLSLVPPDVILYNHYAEGGVGSRLQKDAAFPKGMLDPADKAGKSERAYAYANSVVKNRELLLEKLQPEWIAELTDHLKDSMAGSGVSPQGPQAGPGSPKGMSVDELKTSVGFAAYEKGRADGKAGKSKPAKAAGFEEQNYNLGWSTGNEEKLGAEAAAADCKDFWKGFVAQPPPTSGKKISRAAQEKREEAARKGRVTSDAAIFGALSAARITDASESARLTKERPAWYVLAQLRFLEIDKKKFRPDMHDSFWLSWAAAMKTPPKTTEPT